MKACNCGSHAINPGAHGRDNTDLGMCDVCFWIKRTTEKQRSLAETQRQIIEAAERRGYERAMLECAQDREEAERYRHLRACNSSSLMIVQLTGPGEDDQFVLTESDADAAIDAARAAKGE